MFKKTKERINQNEYIVFIKNMWANKRYRSLLILMVYFIFFFILITGLRGSYQDNDNNTNNSFSYDSIKEEYNNLTNYSYEIFINEEAIIVGNLDNNLNNFVYNNKNYTIINDVIYEEDDDNLKKVDLTNKNIVFTMYDKLMLKDLVNYISTLNQNGIINENSFKLDFEIPNDYFLIEEEGFVNVTVLGNTINKIDEIIVDLTNNKNEQTVIKMKVSDKND